MEPTTTRKTFCFDLDGTLCTNTWGEYDSAEPLPWAIARLNALARAGHGIVILTARGTTTGVDWRERTEAQLADWGVSYDELVFGKPNADVYVDDRTIQTEDWRSGEAVAAPAQGPLATITGAALLPRGATAFEVGRSFGGEPFRADRHAAQLLGAAAELGIPAGPGEPEIAEAAAGAADAGRELIAPSDDVVFTLVVSGPPHAAFVDTLEDAPASMLTVGWRPLSQAAAGLRPFLTEAEGNGYSIGATTRSSPSPGTWRLVVDSDGRLTDPSGGQLILARDGTLLVDHEAGGVAVDFALELAERLGLASERQALGLPDASAADEVVIVGMPFCLLPVSRLDGDAIGAGAPGPLARRLLATWSDSVALDVAGQTRELASI